MHIMIWTNCLGAKVNIPWANKSLQVADVDEDIARMHLLRAMEADTLQVIIMNSKCPQLCNNMEAMLMSSTDIITVITTITEVVRVHRLT